MFCSTWSNYYYYYYYHYYYCCCCCTSTDNIWWTCCPDAIVAFTVFGSAQCVACVAFETADFIMCRGNSCACNGTDQTICRWFQNSASACWKYVRYLDSRSNILTIHYMLKVHYTENFLKITKHWIYWCSRIEQMSNKFGALSLD